MVVPAAGPQDDDVRSQALKGFLRRYHAILDSEAKPA